MLTGICRHRAIFGMVAGAGSCALLLAALGFQYIGGLAPCALCIWQRWPHLASLVLAAANMRFPKPWVALAGAASAMTSAGVGIFHTGVERGAWQGLASCSAGPDISRLSPEAALKAIMTAEVVSCDAVAWEMVGLSMASWNVILSAVIAGIWMLQVRRARGDGAP